MTVGMSATGYANAVLNVLRGGGNGTTFTAPANVYLQFHVGDPGSAGTANVAAVTTRQATTFGAAASGAIALSNSPAYTATGSETISHVSLWSALTVGTFYLSWALTTSKALTASDVLTMTTLGFTLTPLAA